MKLRQFDLDVYNQLNQLGSKIYRTDRYQNSRTVIYNVMLIVLVSVVEEIPQLGYIDPLTKMRIAVINGLEQNKSSYDIPAEHREDFQTALSLVQQECKQPGAPFILLTAQKPYPSG